MSVIVRAPGFRADPRQVRSAPSRYRRREEEWIEVLQTVDRSLELLCSWSANPGFGRPQRIYAAAFGAVGDPHHVYLYRSESGAPDSWELAAAIPEDRPWALCEFNDYLYLATGINGRIYRSPDGITWSVVYDDISRPNIRCLAVFAGRIYAGTDKVLGILPRIIRSANGNDWEIAYEDGSLPVALALSEFAGCIYATILKYMNGQILRSADGTTWIEVYVPPWGDYPEPLLAWDGFLYTSGHAWADIPLNTLRTSDGTTWTTADPHCSHPFAGGRSIYKNRVWWLRYSPTGDPGSWTDLLNPLSGEARVLLAYKSRIYAGVQTGLYRHLEP